MENRMEATVMGFHRVREMETTISGFCFFDSRARGYGKIGCTDAKLLPVYQTRQNRKHSKLLEPFP